jgi:ribonuclease HII
LIQNFKKKQVLNNDMLVCGIDEAGRGPILGPLVMCGILIEEEDEEKLKKLGVKDSKLLTPKQREFLYKKIIKIVKKYKIIITNPEEIDKAVNGHDGLNLNKLEAKKSIEIINSLSPDRAIIDCPSNNIQKYKGFLLKKIKKTELILEHKADYKYPVVAAASIIAKVTRDNEIEKIKEKIKIDFGSGYMSDPKTVEFISKAEDKNKKLINKLKKLEDFGYKFVPIKTSHESVRLKGPCTITLYKSGKLLIQGKDKETIEKILK